MEQKKWNRNDRRPPARRAQEPAEAAENMLEGRNAVQEALAAGRPIDKLYIAAGETDRALARLASMAREAGAAVVETDRRKLDQLSATGAHQGVIAMVAAHAYATVDEILENAKSRGEAPLIVICDELSDPHNLGAIIRSAECVGAHGVIVPERRAVGLTPAAVKASAGAIEHIKVARVVNMTRVIEMLKARNIWTYALTMDGTDYEKVNFKGGVALVTADHGNAEQMVYYGSDIPFTAHTTNKVPFILASPEHKNAVLRQDGKLGNIAPTILELMGLEIPSEMDCGSMIIK